MIGLDSALGIQPYLLSLCVRKQLESCKKNAAFIIFLMVLRTTFPIISKKGNTVQKF